MGTKKYVFGTITVEPVVFLATFVEPVRRGISEDLIYHNVCEESNNKTICDNLQNFTTIENYVQTQSSYWIMGTKIAIFIPALICVMYLGSWSDKFGRKVPMLFPPICGFITVSIYIFVSAVPDIPIWTFLIANFILGLSGNTSASSMTCLAYISATSTESERTVRISRVTAVAALGAGAGPFVIATVIDSIGRTYTLVMLLGIYVTNVLYICFFIENIKPEMSVDATSRNCCSRYFSLKHVKEGFVTAFRKRENGQRKIVLLLLLEFSIILFALIGEANITYLYTVDYPLYWKYSTYSYYSSFRLGMFAFSLLVFTPIAKKYGITDITLCIISVISFMLAMILLGLSYNTVMMFTVPLVGMFANVATATLRSMISLIIGKTEQGKMFSFMAVCQTMLTILGALCYNSTYPVARLFFRGLLLEISAVLLIIPLAINCWMLRRNRKAVLEDEKDEEKVELQNCAKE